MRSFSDESIDLVITSPPYNLRNSTSGNFKKGSNNGTNRKLNFVSNLVNGYDTYDDNLPHEVYVRWQRECLREMLRLIKPDGAIFYNHKWRVQSGLMQDRQDIVNGFPVRQIIIWRRAGGVNFNDGYFVPTYEVIYLICKPQFKLLPTMNRYGDVWTFTQELNNKHPAPFPVNLVKRIISSTAAEIILDPFIGSGTTAVAAVQLKRKYIGIEISETYCKMANERIEQVKNSFIYSTIVEV
ncbi:MAG: site-specific DNA-methyltransferase [Planctomycetaceae bacterium]|jgi:modification methylase|nr:site-specific DNA-methyltransferase [Planctomycetaceae bacterium]